MSGTARPGAARYPVCAFWVSLAVALAAAAARAPLEADDPVSTSVSFNREIIRIVQRKCEPCHARGGLAMSLSDYRDARAWGRAIREELVERRMPPAIVARGYGRYESDPSLNAREMATFLTWLDGGMPRGDDADRPPAIPSAASHAHAAAPPTVRVALPRQTVPPREDVVIRRVVVDAPDTGGRRLARVELRPGNRRVLRGAAVFAGGQWIGGWLPWQHAVAPPPGYTFEAPGGKLTVELYYRGADVELTDESALELALGPEIAAGGIGDLIVDAADRATPRARGALRLARSSTIWAMYPALDAVKSMELRATRPDGSVEVLLWIPRARADWPLALVMQEPLTLPAGSMLSLVADIDGAAARPRVTLSVLR